MQSVYCIKSYFVFSVFTSDPNPCPVSELSQANHANMLAE